MNTNMNHTRLTDALERQLLQEAIEAQHELPSLGDMLVALYRKVATLFRGPEVTIHRTGAAH